MSRPELDIIHSPEAETFLRMVTKGFYDRSYMGLWIYEVIGREWDELRQWSEGMRTEIHPQTCTWSIAIWEWVYGIEPDESMVLPLRRQRLFQNISGARPANQDLIRRNIANILSIPIESIAIDELAGPYAFSVTISDGPDNELMSCGQALSFIRKVKPAHIRLLRLRCEFEPIQFLGCSEYFALKNLRFLLRVNQRNRILLNGKYPLDGSWLLNQDASTFYMVRTNIRTFARMTHRLGPSAIKTTGIGVLTRERVPVNLSMGVYYVDNLGFVRLNGRHLLDGSWTLDQQPRASKFVFGVIAHAVEPPETLWAVATHVRVIQRTEERIPLHLRAGIYRFAPNLNRTASNTALVCHIREREDTHFRRLELAARWQSAHKTVTGLPAVRIAWRQISGGLQSRKIFVRTDIQAGTEESTLRIRSSPWEVKNSVGGIVSGQLETYRRYRMDGSILMDGSHVFGGGDREIIQL